MKDLRDMLNKFPRNKVSFPPTEIDPRRARSLVERIRAGTHPLTREGVVATPLAHGKPSKLKFKEDYDVLIRKIFPAVTKGEPRAGGFEYSLPGQQKVVGKVGTGFTHETLKDMLKNPAKYIGRTARIQAQEQFPSGAYRAPAFLSLHEDIKQKES